jgi:hypothetical protein
MLEASGYVMGSAKLSTMIPLGPLATAAVVIAVFPVVSATHPLVPIQSRVSPKKKKSIPPPILGLKNSVHPVQRAVVERESTCANEGSTFILGSVPDNVNPKAYCQGVVSATPVPQRRITPVVGSLK